jgi:hypothetical protein
VDLRLEISIAHGLFGVVLRIGFSCKKVSIDKASRGVMLWFWILVLGPICIMELSMERIVP